MASLRPPGEKARPYLDNNASESGPSLSPTSDWLAYASDETRRLGNASCGCCQRGFCLTLTSQSSYAPGRVLIRREPHGSLKRLLLPGARSGHNLIHPALLCSRPFDDCPWPVASLSAAHIPLANIFAERPC